MAWELTPALAVALVVGAWRFGRRRPRHEATMLPSVGDAPPDAEPIASPQLDDDGVGTYSLHFSPRYAMRGAGPIGTPPDD